jgi:polyhydroxyalkanoate synthesis regulator protein
MSLENFTRQQEQFRGQMTKVLGATPGAGIMDEAIKRNMAMFEQAMRMWPGMTPAQRAGEAPQPQASASKAADPLDEMRRQMDEMRAQIDRLAGKG